VKAQDIFSLFSLLLIPKLLCSLYLPFKDIPIKNLHNHLQQNKQEEMPEIPTEHQRWKDIVSKMCSIRSTDRYDIGSVETIMGNVYKGRSESFSSVSTNATCV